jgi:hypothetical protein
MHQGLEAANGCVPCQARIRAALQTDNGGFTTDQSACYPGNIGQSMTLTYRERIPQPDTIVALVQIVKCESGPDLATAARAKTRFAGLGTEDDLAFTKENWIVDAPSHGQRTCPIFGHNSFAELSKNATLYERWKSAIPTDPSSNRVGDANKAPDPCAVLHDKPRRTKQAGKPDLNAFHHQFEVVAIRISKDGAVKYLDSITWGYSVDHDQEENQPHTHFHRDTPSDDFHAAVKEWNDYHPKCKIPPETPAN